jgi:hypothetical protein
VSSSSSSSSSYSSSLLFLLARRRVVSFIARRSYNRIRVGKKTKRAVVFSLMKDEICLSLSLSLWLQQKASDDTSILFLPSATTHFSLVSYCLRVRVDR